MVSRLKGAVAVFLVLAAIPVMAEENICVLAGKLVMATEASALETFNREMKDHLYRGTGSLNDIKGDPRNSYLKFSISCGNDVIIMFEVKNAGLMNYRVGQQVSFSGKCISMKKGVYKNTGNRYVLLGFDNTNIM
jgi:hypothetical protein